MESRHGPSPRGSDPLAIVTPGRTVLLPTRDVRFSQPTISRTTYLNDNAISVLGLAQAFREHGFLSQAIDVVVMPDGKLTSLDNRRLWAARKAELEVIPGRVWQATDPMPPNRAKNLRPIRDVVDERGDLGIRGERLLQAREHIETMGAAVISRCANLGLPRRGPDYPLVGSLRPALLTGSTGLTDDARAVAAARTLGRGKNVVGDSPDRPASADPRHRKHRLSQVHLTMRNTDD